MENEIRLLENPETDEIAIEITQVCSCGQRFTDSVFQWPYRVHWLGHKLRAIGRLRSAGLMIGLTMGSPSDKSRYTGNLS